MPIRLSVLAERLGAEMRGDGARVLRAVRSLDAAGPDDVSFVLDGRYRRQAEASGAGALLVPRALGDLDRDLLVVDDPARALAALLAEFDPSPPAVAGVHATAVVDPTAEVDGTATVGPYAVIGARSRVDAQAVVGPHVVVGRDCVLGAGSRLHPHVVLYDRTVIGERTIVHAGVVLGGDGFGYSHVAGEHLKRPHLGRAVLGADVEVGANSAIDRGMVEDTVVGDGTKVDNLVQVGHNVRVGRGCILCGQVGVAGTAVLEDFVVLGGQAGVADHVTVGTGTQVAAKSAVLQSAPARATLGGIPAMPLAEWRRQTIQLRRLRSLVRRLRALERALGPGVRSAGDRDGDEAEET